MDIAALGLKVDDDGVISAISSLDKFKAAANDAGRAADKVGKDSAKAGDGAKKLASDTDRAEGSLRSMSGTAVRLGGALATAFSFAKIATDIATTNAEFQRLSAVMKVATGSAEAADVAMGKIRAFAAETPYELSQSIEAFVRLKNLGLDPTIETMRSFGNTASSMGKDIMQFVEAVADATTGEFERLKEFGIRASDAGDKVAFTFRGVTTVVGDSASEIQRYLDSLGRTEFAGAMAEQMNTLGGQFSNLIDNINALYVAIGRAGANTAMAQALSLMSDGAIWLANNLDTIIDLVGTTVVAFGAYKATLLVTTAAQALMSGQLGIMIGMVSATTAQFGLLAGAQVTMAGASALAATALRGLTAAMITNPATAVAVAIAALAAGIYYLSTRTDEATSSQSTLSATSGALARITSEVTHRTSELASATGEARKEALQNVQALKAEAERYLAVAGAAAVAARAKALAAYQAKQEAANSKMEQLSRSPGSLMGAYGIHTREFDDATKAAAEAEAAANKASKEWLDWNKQVGLLQDQIEAATKPIKLAATATGDSAKASNAASKAADEYRKSLEALLDMLYEVRGIIIGQSGAMSDAFAKAFADAAAKDMADAIQAAADSMDAMQAPLHETADANAEWNEQLKDTIRWLDKIGGYGSAIGDIGAALIGLRTGDFSGVDGKAGALLETLAGIQWKDDSGTIRKLGEEFTHSLESVFGKDFGNVFLNVLQGAGTGAAIGGIAFGSKEGQLGAMAGGALGQEFGEKFLSKGLETISKGLGDFAGPLGSIAGSLIGGLLGGALSPTKRGGATFGGSGADLGVGSTWGNSSERIDAATGLAGNVVSALQQIADAFGATLGTFTGSISVREGNLRYDPTGQGISKTSKGAINFGQDQEALLKAAIADAISDGVFDGLSDGVKRLLANGDIETQLQKALSFQSVFTELASAKDPMASALSDLDKWKSSMADIFAEAGASAEQVAQLEELYGLKRAAIVEQSAQDAFEAARPMRELEIQLLQAQGKETEALAAARQLELDGMTAEEQAIQKQIYRFQDEQAAAQEAAQAAADLARAQQAVAAERYNLETQLLQLQGNTVALRQRELDAMDESLRPLQQRIWALQDEQAAAQEAAQAAADLARAQQAVAAERYNLETQLLQLQGNTVALRQRELDALDPSNRAILQQIYAIQDRQAAEEAAIKAAQDVMAQRNDMINSYNQEASSLSSFISRFRDLSASIREFRAGLLAPDQGSPGALASAQSEFQKVARLAALGNENSLQSFTGVSQAFLDAARDNATSLVDYQRAIGLVIGASDAAADGADRVARGAQAQLDAIQASVAQLEALNAATQQSIDTLGSVDAVQQKDVVPTLEQLVDEQKAAREDAAQARTDQQSEAAQLIVSLNTVARLLSRWDRGDYAAIGYDGEGAVPVTVSNTAASPVPVDQVP